MCKQKRALKDRSHSFCCLIYFSPISNKHHEFLLQSLIFDWLLVLSLNKEVWTIYKFLNVCPFDYMAFAVSGKVERS